jgi:ABC-2 type transport system ATP-binding protein
VDPVARREFWDIIYKLAEGGTTVFVTTHYMDEAEYCHRLGLMHQGKLVAIGTPGSLRQRMPGQVLEVEAEPLGPALEAVSALPGLGEAAIFGRAVRVHATSARAVEEVTRSLEAGGLAVRRVEAVPPSLEDVFLAMVEHAEADSSPAPAASD